MKRYLIAVDKQVTTTNRLGSPLMLFEITDGVIRLMSSRIIEAMPTEFAFIMEVEKTIHDLKRLYKFEMNQVYLLSDFPVVLKDRDVKNRFVL